MTGHDETQLDAHSAPGQPGAEEPTPSAEQEAAEQPLPEQGAPGEEAAPEEELDPLAAAEKKAAEYLALAQRTQADFENFRRRSTRDAAVAGDRGMTKLAKELLPSLDHLELALRSAEEHGGEEFAKGIRLVQQELIGALARVGIQPFSPQGEPFDPVEHEAMASQPVEGTEPGTVAEVYQQGYRINGAVLRPARVVVAA
jgi:molecular chaperone GrpE